MDGPLLWALGQDPHLYISGGHQERRQSMALLSALLSGCLPAGLCLFCTAPPKPTLWRE